MRHTSNHPEYILGRLPMRYFRDAVTHEKIHRHLTDINDTITDDDIRNIRIILSPDEARKREEAAHLSSVKTMYGQAS